MTSLKTMWKALRASDDPTWSSILAMYNAKKAPEDQLTWSDLIHEALKEYLMEEGHFTLDYLPPEIYEVIASLILRYVAKQRYDLLWHEGTGRWVNEVGAEGEPGSED